ncbi:PREDICTED: F-box/LRR-repeat protein At1g55660-like isoform X1 [Erythranthe guttata]|uniref:F-box/LRR-repeat protein At1g55660-like isoform X1 n=1 Tax=Erythranthe guttata TaxID=4155 RepID=UPI00064DD517|nr:PREDICTED: F-box/LRR-repeat protein At1g55660-like isoform X1 [Erythranthe guttata]|eukprot:XP_012849845.1 PREDICTED: F-box/LRR-repeat protein At1g55660-like isoform X1 [Erythranthe guttata]
MMQNLFGDQSEEEEKEVEAVESERESNRQPDYASCAKRSFVGDNGDRISRLPDELLVDILSLLSLKEAARTSVLSPRWINLWKHTHSLNFDARNALEDIVKKHWIRRKLMKREGPKYVKWVNTVLQSHKSPTLKEFVIRFTLDATAKNSINLWLQFAFATRQVERLELDLLCYFGSGLQYWLAILFP